MESKKICSACGKIIEEKGLELGGKLYHASCAKKELIRIEKELTKIEPYIRDLKESWEKGGGRMENIGREALELIAHYVGYRLDKAALEAVLRAENAHPKEEIKKIYIYARKIRRSCPVRRSKQSKVALDLLNKELGKLRHELLGKYD
jgi:ethanolamine utilization protein EutA (predicted chaperonin)